MKILLFYLLNWCTHQALACWKHFSDSFLLQKKKLIHSIDEIEIFQVKYQNSFSTDIIVAPNKTLNLLEKPFSIKMYLFFNEASKDNIFSSLESFIRNFRSKASHQPKNSRGYLTKTVIVVTLKISGIEVEKRII